VLSYRLLKIVNSAITALNIPYRHSPRAPHSGPQRDQEMDLAHRPKPDQNDEPTELIRAALVRGIFMEKLALYQKKRKNRTNISWSGCSRWRRPSWIRPSSGPQGDAPER
jgi:hypothetical protein